MKSIGLGAVGNFIKKTFSVSLRIVRFPLRLLRLLVSFALRHLFGSVSWSAPFWLRKLGDLSAFIGRAIKSRPKMSLLGLIAFIVLSSGSLMGYMWWKSRPHPVEVTFAVTAPTRTEIEATNEAQRAPKPLTIIFNESVATLAASGKDVSSGVALAPEHPGKWHWQNDRMLSFTPAEDWPIGKKIRGQFSEIAIQTRSLARRI